MRTVRRLLKSCIAAAALFSAVPALSGDFELLRLDGEYLKWGAPTFGTAAEVTYSYVREFERFPAARNCRAMVPPSALTEKSGMSFKAFDVAVRRAFEQWESAANIRFHYVADPRRANILIGAQAEPTGIAFTNVVPSKSVRTDGPAGAVAALERSTICFNPSLLWNAALAPSNRGRDLMMVAGHEIGHAIGLDHPGPRGAMMAFKEEFATRELQDSDVHAIQTLYGPTPAAAAPRN